MIRAYQDEDIESVLSVWYNATIAATPFLSAAFLEQERRNIREIYIPNTITWAYEKDDEVVGFIAMMGNEVGAIFVDPVLHGTGIGAKLMNHVAEVHDELEVEVFERNKIGSTFYDKYGFKEISSYMHDKTGEKMLRLKFVNP